MGYDIVSYKTLKDSKEKSYEDGIVFHISCQYAYQPLFRKAFGCDITNWDGRLTKNKRSEFIKGLDNFISILQNNKTPVPIYDGNVSNTTDEKLIIKCKELKNLILENKIGYLSIS